MKDHVAADWSRIFACNGLRTFEDFWNLGAGWFEEPNRRRGGWSGVARCEFKLPEGGTVRVFLKKQENHVTRTWRHPFRGMPTFQREFENSLLYAHLGIPSLTPAYFAIRKDGRNQRAIFITEELTGFRSLEDWTRDWRNVPAKRRARIIRPVARLLRQIHDCCLTHNCFYPKHVFLREQADGSFEARIIDLEKTKRHWLRPDHDYRDIRRLNGPHLPWTRTDRVLFFREYLGIEGMTDEAKTKWRRIERRHWQKHPRTSAVMDHTTAPAT